MSARRNTPRPKPSATALWGCTADTMRHWWLCRRQAMQCGSVGCPHPRYNDGRMCLGHQVLGAPRAVSRAGIHVSSDTDHRHDDDATPGVRIRERIDAQGWSQGEWTAMVGIPQSSGSKAIRDPDAHRVTFRKIANHFGFEEQRDGSFRKRSVGRAA